jgi:MOSC domain-containing protein YiiM
MPPHVNQHFMIDAERFVDEASLAEAYARCAPAPRDHGRVCLLVARLGGIERAMPQRAEFSLVDGFVGDVWNRRPPRDINAQVTVMRHDVATFIANGQSLGLFGDNVFVDLDISSGNLPPGSRIRVGQAVVVVTPEPHIGCRKFKERFGHDALRFVNQHELRSHQLRGIHWRVVEPGPVAVGDSVEVMSR